MRNWSKPGKLTARNSSPRPPPSGTSSGAQPSLTNPFGGTLPAASGTAPNAKPGAPPTIVQQQGQPATAPAKKTTSNPKARTGDEYRAPDAPKPIEQLSPKDRTATAAHLASTVAGNLGHGTVHLEAANKIVKRLKGHPEAATLKHNLNHASKHVTEAAEHAEKLNQHLSQLPGVQGAVDELAEATPMDKPKKKAAKES